MTQSAMTIRLDSSMKAQFDNLCSQFGMSANTAINIFVNAVVRSRSIPFSISLASENTSNEKALEAFEKLRQEASTLPEMTLEEINEEIRAARRERKERLDASTI